MFRPHPWSAALLVVAGGVLGAAGCTESLVAPPHDAGVDAPPATPSDAGVGVDARVLADAGAEDAATSDGAVRGGSIYAISDTTRRDDGGVVTSSRAGAYFVVGPSSTDHVVEQTFGPCVAATITPGTGEPGPDVSAGAVSVTGGARPITLTPDPDGTYPPRGSSSLGLWSGGERLTAQAEGGVVPAFQASLVAPSAVTLLAPSPAPDAGRASLRVARASSLPVAWSGVSSGALIVYFAAAAATEARTLTCTFPLGAGDAGTGATIPADALGTLPRGTATFDAYVKERASPVVPGWNLSFVASRVATDADGFAVTGTAELL